MHTAGECACVHARVRVCLHVHVWLAVPCGFVLCIQMLMYLRLLLLGMNMCQ